MVKFLKVASVASFEVRVHIPCLESRGSITPDVGFRGRRKVLFWFRFKGGPHYAASAAFSDASQRHLHRGDCPNPQILNLNPWQLFVF